LIGRSFQVVLRHRPITSDMSPAQTDAALSTLDPLVVNPGRLSILLALSIDEAGVEFVDLRRKTRLTDGNLASHARRLADGGLIDIAKQFRAGKPVTTYQLTPTGKQSLQSHVDGLVSVVRVAPLKMAAAAQPVASVYAEQEDDWVD
jgi:hypothetical protein